MELMDEIRRRVREKHLQKKELERQQHEEQKKELERCRRLEEEQKKELERRQRKQPMKDQALQSSKPMPSEKDEYTRVKGRYGWTWTKQSNNDADTQQHILTDERPSVRRPFDSALLSSLKTEETRAATLGSFHSGPVSYLTKTVVASPLSDISYSQSPSKKSVSFTGHEVTVTTARRILMEKELKEAANNVEDPAIIARRALMEKERKEAARNVEDLVTIARRALMEKEAARKEAARKEAGESSPAKVVLPPLPRLPVNRNEYVHEDPVEISRRLAREKEEARARQEKEEARAKEARNPIALLERNNEGQHSFSPLAERNNTTPTKVADSTLWDDSENEGPNEEEKEEEEDKKKKKAIRKKTSEVKKGAKQRSSLGSASDRYADESDDDFDDEFENTLIPTFDTFDNPEGGPPSAMEPLKLLRGDSADDFHEVPASINRYLKPYQREGVAFLYSCVVVRGTGAVLGDVSTRVDR